MSKTGFPSEKMIMIFKVSSEKSILMSDYIWVSKNLLWKKVTDHHLFFSPSGVTLKQLSKIKLPLSDIKLLIKKNSLMLEVAFIFSHSEKGNYLGDGVGASSKCKSPNNSY